MGDRPMTDAAGAFSANRAAHERKVMPDGESRSRSHGIPRRRSFTTVTALRANAVIDIQSWSIATA